LNTTNDFWLIDSNFVGVSRFYKDRDNSDKSIDYMFIEEGIIMGIHGENPPLMKTRKKIVIEEARISIKKKIIQKGCDYLFANPIDLEGQGFGFLAQNEGWLFDNNNKEHYINKTSKIDLANKLITQIILISNKININNLFTFFDLASLSKIKPLYK